MGYGTSNSLIKDYLYNYTQVRLDSVALNKTLTDIKKPIIVDCTGPNSVNAAKNMSLRQFDMGIETTIKFCESAISRGGIFAYISSAAVYGNNIKSVESVNLAPVSKYGEYKAKVEDLLCNTYGETGRIKIIRPFSLYGEDQKKQLIWDAYNKINSIKSHHFFGTGQEKRDWMHISDFCELFEMFITYKSENLSIINAGTGCGTTVEDAIKYIAKCTGSDSYITFDGSEDAAHPKNLVADITKISRLGFQNKVHIWEGISKCIHFWRSNYDS